MVRLRHLRLRRHLHLRRDLSRGYPAGDPACADDFRGVVPGQTARRTGLGSARRPTGPQARTGHHHPDDGRRHVVRRSGSVLRDDRLLGAGADGAAAHGPGLLHRRRVRRCRHVHGRVRAVPSARFLRQLPGVRHAGRLLARRAADARLLAGAQRRPDAFLGLATAVPGGRPARPDRCVSAVAARGHPDLPGAGGGRREGGAHRHAIQGSARPDTGGRSCGSAAWSSRSTW